MGLDMYLYRKTYVKNWSFMKPEELTQITVLRDGKPYPGIDTNLICYITEEVAYWRKANQIHAWFVKNCQGGKDDCQEYYVSTEQLQELSDICKGVLALKEDAEKLLPTQSGFFFGGTEYDDYYFEDLEETIKQLEPLLTSKEETYANYYYQSSW